jgi:hypothetical protein
VTYFSSAQGDVGFPFESEGGSFELAGGIESQATKGTSFFLSGLYRTAFNGNRHDYGVKAGVRWDW